MKIRKKQEFIRKLESSGDPTKCLGDLGVPEIDSLDCFGHFMTQGWKSLKSIFALQIWVFLTKGQVQTRNKPICTQTVSQAEY